MSDRVVTLLDLYETCARPWLNQIFKPNTCIEQTRVLLEVIQRFGVRAEAVGTKLIVKCEAREYCFISGLDADELHSAMNTAKRFILHGNDHDATLNRRHVCALVDQRFLADSTLHQASSEQFGVKIPAAITVIGPLAFPSDHRATGSDVTAEYALDDGARLAARWITTPDRDWLDDPAWEPSHLWRLIDRIERDMRRNIVQ